jgi:hypothetical protein
MDRMVNGLPESMSREAGVKKGHDMRRFVVDFENRWDKDIVAEGVLFSNGAVVIIWKRLQSLCVYPTYKAFEEATHCLHHTVRWV